MDLREKTQEEAVRVALENNYCTLDIIMRLGKTRIGLLVASKFKRVLVCYPSNAIKKSWTEDGEKFEIDISRIEFTTYRSIHKYELEEYDLVILDEIQNCSIANWEFICVHLPNRILGLSGTVPNSGQKKHYINRWAPVRYKKALEETVGLVNKDYRINVHLLSPSDVKDIPLSKGGFWSEKAKINFWERKYNDSRHFMDMLRIIQTIQGSNTKLEYAKRLLDKKERAMVFVETIEQCESFGVPTYHSKNKLSEENLVKFKLKEINKLASVRQISSGITVDVDNIIVEHCYSSNDKAAQRLARALNFVEGGMAEIDVIALAGTRDEVWCKNGLMAFDNNKITYIRI